MALAEAKLHSILESLLMITPEPVPVGRLVEVIQIEDPQTDEEAVRKAIQSLVASYQDPKRPMARGFRVDEVSGGLQFRTTPENAPYVRRFLAAKPQRLSKPALETLAIIAYRQPVTKPEIEAIRGVDVGAALKNLLDRDFVRILGKKDEVGRPIIYGTTELFLEFFGLRSLAELPTLREYHDLDDEHQKEVDALGGQSVRELANAAQFLVEVEDDPDIDAVDQAVAHADQVRRAAEAALDPNAVIPKDEPAPPAEDEADAAQTDGGAGESTSEAAAEGADAAEPVPGEDDAGESAPDEEDGAEAASDEEDAGEPADPAPDEAPIDIESEPAETAASDADGDPEGEAVEETAAAESADEAVADEAGVEDASEPASEENEETNG